MALAVSNRLGTGARRLIASLCLAAGACSGGKSTPEGLAATTTSMGGLNNYALVIPERASPQLVEDAATLRCRGQTHCSVYGWRNASQAASAFPMLDREIETLNFVYALNRATNYESARWRCGEPAADPEACL